MANFQAAYYRDKDGNQPVKQFLQTLDDYHKLTIEDQIEMLRAYPGRQGASECGT